MQELIDTAEVFSSAATETAEDNRQSASCDGACGCQEESVRSAVTSGEIVANSGGGGNAARQQSSGFRLDFSQRDRLDLIAAEALASIPRYRRDNLIAHIHAGRLEHLLPKNLAGQEALPTALRKRAAINIVDYAFEALVLPTMNFDQLNQYFLACNKTLQMPNMANVVDHGPLWFDTVHHVCNFSVIYTLAAQLRNKGYRKFIVLHQGDKPEPRLDLLTRGGGWWTFIKFEPGWIEALAENASPDSAIFYPADVPLDAPDLLEPHKQGQSIVRLGANGRPIQIELVTGSAAVARKLGAVHMVLDYPSGGKLELRRFDSVNPAVQCPLEDWAFWPALAPTPAREC